MYRLLGKLTEIGLIEESLTKPVIFTAVPIEQALNSALIKHNSERALMEALRQEIVEEVNAFLYQQMHPIPSEARFKLVRGGERSTVRCGMSSSPPSVRLPLSSPPMGSTNGHATVSSTTAPHAPRMALMCAASSPPT